MMEKAKKTKIIIGLSYLVLLTIFVLLFFSKFSIQEITSYDFIKENRLYFLKLKNSNLFLISIIFLIFTILWVFPFLGFGSPIALLGGYLWQMVGYYNCGPRFEFWCNISLYFWKLFFKRFS